jgi:hypothetical protein
MPRNVFSAKMPLKGNHLLRFEIVPAQKRYQADIRLFWNTVSTGAGILVDLEAIPTLIEKVENLREIVKERGLLKNSRRRRRELQRSIFTGKMPLTGSYLLRLQIVPSHESYQADIRVWRVLPDGGKQPTGMCQ